MRHPYWAVVPLSLCATFPAFATPMVQPTHTIYACVDPRATTALAIPDGRLRNQKWVDYVHRTGHCYALPADRSFSVVAQQGQLVLVRAAAADSDMPPVYAQASDVKAVADSPAQATDAAPPPPAAPTETAASPTDPAASPAAVASPATPPATGAPAATPPSPAADPSASVPTPAAAPAPGSPASDASTAPGSTQAPVPVPTITPPMPTPTPSPDAAAPVTAPLGTPAPAPAPVRSSGISLLLVGLVMLALLGLVGVAVAIARQQRRFAHVEGRNWPPEDDGRDPFDHAPPVAAAPVHRMRSPQALREECIAVLKQGGWQIQPSFAATAADGTPTPDIVGRKQNALLAVRCRPDGEPVTHATIEEAATMGRAAGAHVTVLVSDAPMTQRAHDDALRLHVHVLPAEDLASLSA